MMDVWQERRDGAHKREDDIRNEWERDYARLIHSSAFRRLQSKTQVLGLGESDFYRTRLTHSMEVSQIGVGIVHWLRRRHEAQQDIIKALPRSALMSSICLAHDIGHPPFGHGGEVALNICMRDYGGFEGNGQTLRILSRLDKYTHHHGLNPTRRLLLGVLKYPASYSATVNMAAYGAGTTPQWLAKAKTQKPPKCYLNDEKDVVEWVLAPLSNEERRAFTEVTAGPSENAHFVPKHKSLDTSIMELSDDISYSLHDLEDAISLGMVNRQHWDEHMSGNSGLFSTCKLDFAEISDQLFAKESYLRKQAIGTLVHAFILSTQVQPSLIPSAQNELIRWNAVMDSDHKKLRKHIFELVVKKVIKSANVQQLEFKGQKIVIELFNALSSDPTRLLPGRTIEKYEQTPDDAGKARVICDFISGMTDEYCTRLYEKLYYPHKGSIFDHL
ncbi:deoxyguanosinetriphosphate triphosphohydrolase family protein [Pseudomonas entomophila]|uniref:anti-phage deoxyguanosine triphosphatase n=1 Tax=Pseudomonas entomophila TaxID=312306 RepID=UPI001BCBEA5D|nr:anti-phage deoxyguanosine triphosphatase [Pseudomonas entomophila]QVM89238.1 deoxyguanosinetriphosphate triphosphohydrolase family protein [Pseudomonas entomophila]